MANAQRLETVLNFITANRDKWNQGMWAEKTACGTTGCLAGWGGVLYAREQLTETVISKDFAEYNPIGMDWTDLGAQVFELDYFEAEELFSGDNSLRALWELASDYTDGAVQVPADLED